MNAQKLVGFLVDYLRVNKDTGQVRDIASNISTPTVIITPSEEYSQFLKGINRLIFPVKLDKLNHGLQGIRHPVLLDNLALLKLLERVGVEMADKDGDLADSEQHVKVLQDKVEDLQLKLAFLKGQINDRGNER